MHQYLRDALEAVERLAPVAWFGDVVTEAGYERGTVGRAIYELHKSGCLERAPGGWRLTDRGAIALAISRGKEHRRRSRGKP